MKNSKNSKNRKKQTKQVLASAVAVSFLASNMGGVIAHAAGEDLQIAINPSPNVDVVLSIGNTTWNPANFSTDLKSRLSSKGIDVSKVNVQAVDMNQLNAQSAFTWNQQVSSSVGQISFLNSGSTIYMTGNTSNPGFNKIYTNNNNDPDLKEQTMSFTYNLDYGDNFDGAGVLINTDVQNGVLNGYGLIFLQSGVAKLYKLNGFTNNEEIYQGGSNANGTVNSKATLIGSLSMGASGSFSVKMEKDKVTVINKANGTTVGSLALPTHYGWGFGFFSDHYSHGCNIIGQFTLNNITLETKKSKTFNEAIRGPEWRDGSERFIVNLEDKLVPDFDNAQTSGEISTRLMNDEISYVALGTATNQAQANNFISRNNGDGTFINNSNYATAMDNLANYIAAQIAKSGQVVGDSQYVLVGEPVNINVIPASLAKNTQNDQYPQGRWKIDHDYTHYENNLGQASWAGQWQKDLQMVFDKPGRYELWFEDKHPNPRYVYAHRRPVADFGLTITPGTNFTVTTTDRSYDPDAQSTADRGIAQYEWKWRETTATTWNDGQIPSTLPQGKDYVIQLRVKDKQGAWSQPESRYVTTTGAAVKPVAGFEMLSKATRYDNLTIQNSSYDPSGKPITQTIWTVLKNGVQVYTGATPITNFNAYGVGTYSVSLKVMNSSSLWSESFKREIEITEDTTKPEATFSLTNQPWTNKNVNVGITFTDGGGSGFSQYRYAVTNSSTFPTTGFTAWTSGTSVNIPITAEGRWYVHVEAKDGAGNLMQRSMGEYQIDKTAPNAPTFGLSTSAPTNKDVSVTVTYPSDAVQKQYKIDNGVWVDYTAPIVLSSNATVYGRAVDAAGNISTSSQVIVSNIDKVAPVQAILTPDKTAPTNTDVLVTASGFSDDVTVKEYKIGTSGTWTPYTAPVVMTENGTVFVRSKDAAGNVSEEASYTVNNIDKVAPVDATLTPDKTAPTNTDVMVTISYPTDGAFKEYKVGNGAWMAYTAPVVLSENDTVSARSKDVAGNWSNVTSYAVTNIDKVAPSLSLTPNTTAPTNKDVIVTVSASDSYSGVAVKKYAKGTLTASDFATGGTELTGNSFVVDENDTFTVYVKDKAGNETIQTIVVSNIDKVAPTTPVFSADITTPTNQDVTVAISFPTDAFVKEYKIGASGTWTAYNSPVVMTADGTVFARAIDDAGNISDEGSYVVNIIDKVLPTPPVIKQEIDVISLTPGTDDRNGIKATEYRINGGTWMPYTGPLKLADGEYTIEAKSTDGVGNENVFTLHTYVYDDTLKKAEFLTKQAEMYPAQSKINEAYEVVNKLPDVAPEKKPLIDRLKAISDLLSEKSTGIALDNLERQVDRGSPTEDLLKEWYDKLDALERQIVDLDDGPMKDELQDKLDSLKDKIDILDKLVDAGYPNSITDLDKVKDLIDQLPDGSLKDKLEKDLNGTSKLNEVKELIAELEKHPSDDALSKAKDAWGQLPSGSDKSELKPRLDAAEKLVGAIHLVEKAESTLSKADYDKALVAVDNLPDSELKNSLKDRLADIADKAEVTGLVEKAEKTRAQSDIDKARQEVNKLPDGNFKDRLTERLDKIDNALSTATKLVKAAETGVTQTSIDRAQNAIDKLVNSPQKDKLQDRLDAVKNKLRDKQYASSLADALKKVDQADQNKRNPYISNAYDAVNRLPDSPEKQAMLDRLDAIVASLEEKANSGLDGEFHPGDNIVDVAATIKDVKTKNIMLNWAKAVERAERYFSKSNIKYALEKMDQVPSSISTNPKYKPLYDEMKKRSDVLKVVYNEMVKDKALERVLLTVTNSVDAYEKYKTPFFKQKAQQSVDSLDNPVVKQLLQDRIDAVHK